MRTDGRQPDALRPLRFQRRYTGRAAGSVLVAMGRTTVLCTCSVEATVPAFLVGTGKGWLTAEYSMLPGSTSPRKARDRGGKVDGRSVEIQRLIGRSLRTVVDLDKLGERTLWIDCDVLEADGGTRTAASTGPSWPCSTPSTRARANSFIALARSSPDSVAAVSVGLLHDSELARPGLLRGQGRRGGLEPGDDRGGPIRRGAGRRRGGDLQFRATGSTAQAGQARHRAITAAQREALGGDSAS